MKTEFKSKRTTEYLEEKIFSINAINLSRLEVPGFKEIIPTSNIIRSSAPNNGNPIYYLTFKTPDKRFIGALVKQGGGYYAHYSDLNKDLVYGSGNSR